MKTILNVEGKIGIPDVIRAEDALVAGDSFELERVTAGRYLLTKQPGTMPSFSIAVAADGLPVIRATGLITSDLVKEIEAQIL